MSNYFIFNGKDSRDFEIQLAEYPPIVSPVERIETITVPGRSGTLHMREGEGVYDSYTKNFEIVALNPERIPEIKKWLRGRGELIVGNELDYIYDGYINAETEFTRFFRGWRKATIPIEVQPFKFSRKKKQIYFDKTETEFEINEGNVSDYDFNIVVKDLKEFRLKNAIYKVLLNGIEIGWGDKLVLAIVVNAPLDENNNLPEADENNYFIRTTVNIAKREVESRGVIGGKSVSYITPIESETTPFLQKGKNTIQLIRGPEDVTMYLEHSEVQL